MEQDFSFFKTVMPESRKADIYLGCLGGSVFFDFNQSNGKLISLCRISFHGYGCCEIADTANSLNLEMSQKLIEEIEKDKLDQPKLTPLVIEIIRLNKEYIWTDALEEYSLLD
ncbi:hypothetical protein QEG73_19610 [Chitinophagaceae bacterium 26-R-25]|nr:hypothetical protein [Chitinophagaceae bacterium 26-R-25]